jgi:hypothetical protein
MAVIIFAGTVSTSHRKREIPGVAYICWQQQDQPRSQDVTGQVRFPRQQIAAKMNAAHATSGAAP